jgi:hypothetical protein
MGIDIKRVTEGKSLMKLIGLRGTTIGGIAAAGLALVAPTQAAAADVYVVVSFYNPDNASCLSVASEPFAIPDPTGDLRQANKFSVYYQFLNFLYENDRTSLDVIVNPRNRVHRGYWFHKSSANEAEAEAKRRYLYDMPAGCRGNGTKVRVSMDGFRFKPYVEGSNNFGVSQERQDLLKAYISGN